MPGKEIGFNWTNVVSLPRLELSTSSMPSALAHNDLGEQQQVKLWVFLSCHIAEDTHIKQLEENKFTLTPRRILVGHHFFETMCPTAFLAPTLIAKTCFICTQPKHAFFLAQLALQGHRANGKKPIPGRVPGPKKGTKMVPKSWSFQKEFFCSVAKKKSQKLALA